MFPFGKKKAPRFLAWFWSLEKMCLFLDLFLFFYVSCVVLSCLVLSCLVLSCFFVFDILVWKTNLLSKSNEKSFFEKGKFFSSERKRKALLFKKRKKAFSLQEKGKLSLKGTEEAFLFLWIKGSFLLKRRKNPIEKKTKKSFSF